MAGIVKVNNAVAFSEEIERLHTYHKDLTYLEVIMLHIQDKKIEIDSVPKLLTPILKKKLEDEGYRFHLLKGKQKSKLPLVDDE